MLRLLSTSMAIVFGLHVQYIYGACVSDARRQYERQVVIIIG